MEEKTFVPRINQLDAATLDSELIATFNKQISNAFKYFIRNPLDTIGPELEAVLRTIIWKFTIWDKQRSIGQELLGIKYKNNKNSQLYGLAGAGILLHYLKQRQSFFLKFVPLSEQTKNLALHYANIAVGTCRLVTSLLFLRQGVYPSLATLVLDLTPVSTIEESRSIGYSYMSRELLWSTFTELLIFLVPLLNSSKIKSQLSRRFSSSLCKPATHLSLSQCSLCSRPPILPCRGPCGHVYCYYCMASSMDSNSSARCSVCGAEVTEETVNYVA
eukprot:GFUD01002979.1.p1 GENE.GFUD01002979.1~~GFUD01002979.1.p1  ORF type:complete len:274 (-),score=48.42 GFUD01002979.1:218-1039(-)